MNYKVLQLKKNHKTFHSISRKGTDPFEFKGRDGISVFNYITLQ